MRIGVISDSHGYTGRLSTVLMAMEADGPLDAIIHLGDGYYDLTDLNVPLPPVYQAAGNCDFFQQGSQMALDLWGAHILATHGHMYHVKQNTDSLLALALEEKFQAVLYGHTHVQKCQWQNGILLLNPGAAMDGRYALLTINRLGAMNVTLGGD